MKMSPEMDSFLDIVDHLFDTSLRDLDDDTRDINRRRGRGNMTGLEAATDKTAEMRAREYAVDRGSPCACNSGGLALRARNRVRKKQMSLEP
jgi:4-aminobutyrate aminotransferase-like enzyme